MKCRGALALGLLALVLLALVLLPRRDALGSADPAALRLLPPGSRVPVLATLDGERLPVAGWEPGDPRRARLSDWRVEDGNVFYRRGSRWESVALESLVRDAGGQPRIETWAFPAGTDAFGRDLLARLVAGARVSLLVGLGGVLGAALIGALAGLATALGGRVVAGLVRRLEDAFLAIPRVLLVMALAAVVQPTAAGLAVLLAATGWPALGRLVRGDLRGLAASEISAAARAAGATRWRLAWRHLLPHAAVTLLVAAGLRVGPFVLLEASLSFLGFGVPPPHPSWGNILAEGRDVLFEAWWVTALPGALLAATVLLANAAADRFRQAIG